MTAPGQKRQFDPLPATSGLPLRTDIVRPPGLKGAMNGDPLKREYGSETAVSCCHSPVNRPALIGTDHFSISLSTNF